MKKARTANRKGCEIAARKSRLVKPECIFSSTIEKTAA
jgi:hypothetical protein